MGVCLSCIGGMGTVIEQNDGGEKDFHNRFIEDRDLGEGEFGVVTLVHDLTIRRANKQKNSSADNRNTKNDEESGRLFIGNDDVGCDYDNSSMACKALRKGMVIKYNTLYAPLKPEVLRREVDILRKLKGESFCLKISSVYETPKVIYIITELCSGGDMFQYVSRRKEDLRADEVSRISFQLLSAVNHCANNNVINRDIKPENIMFVSCSSESELRLIDFGSGTDKVVEGLHTTFAGTAFYISPEMFQNTYTQKTDVWSAGVCLYVLVAGYPSDKLQTAFNMMHKITPGKRNLKNLPNLPDNLPDSFYVMLNQLLEYKHKIRKKASVILESDFVRFHKFASSVDNSNIIGSVGRHALFLDYQKFERCLTTLLATMLTKSELIIFLNTIQNKSNKAAAKDVEVELDEKNGESIPPNQAKTESKSLDVVNVHRVMEILKESEKDQVISMIEQLPRSELYESNAYDISVLKYFVGVRNSVREKHSGSKKRSSASSRARGLGKIPQWIDSSIHSVGAKVRMSLDFSAHSTNSARMRPTSMDGSYH
mmetsp:Transcript_19777/g.22290  ORF Transcript_19777/g.22290 Transcript_19777/m.22290 type:complete len:541 (-) Transcript_19777:47-1669(-)